LYEPWFVFIMECEFEIKELDGIPSVEWQRVSGLRMQISEIESS